MPGPAIARVPSLTSRLRAVDSDKDTIQVSERGNSSIDPCGKPCVVQILRGDDDPGVRVALVVQPDEMLAVLGQHRTAQRVSESEDFSVRNPLAVSARLADRKDVMPQGSQLDSDRSRDVLVGIQSG